MYKNILRKINFGIYLVLTLFIVIVQSTIFSYFPLNYIQPDLFLILVIFLGLRRDSIEGASLVMIGSIIMEMHSSAAPNFLFSLYLYAFVIAQCLSKMVIISDLPSAISVVAGLTILKKIGLLVLYGIYGLLSNSIKHFFIYLIPGIIIQVIITPACFAWFRQIDLKTYKDKHAEDEYDINKEF